MSKPKSSSLTIILFGLPFTVAGLALFYFLLAPDLTDWYQMRQWQPVQATIEHAELLSRRGSDSTTYQVQAQYQYRFQGADYRGTRVGISTSYDNIGRYQRSMAQRLRRAQAQGQPVTVWVNPDNPSEAVIDRALRAELLLLQLAMSVVFLSVGIGLVAYGWLTRKAVLQHPGDNQKPWLTRREWASETIACDGRTTLIISWAFAGIWNLIALPVTAMIPSELAAGNRAILWVLIFTAVGLGLLYWALRCTLDWRRFGPMHLHLDPYPGAIGGHLGGSIDLALPPGPEHHFHVTVDCLYSYSTGSGKNRSRSERSIWQAKGVAHQSARQQGSQLRFRFDVPEGLPSSEPPHGDYHHWRLILEGQLPQGKLHRQFALPVFATGAQSRLIKQDSLQHPDAQAQRELAIESALSVRQIPGGVELYYPPLRNAGMKLGFLVFGLIFLGAGVTIHYLDGLVFLPGVFAFLGGATVIGCLYLLLNSLQVKLDQTGLHSQRRWLGIAVRRQHCPKTEIRHLSLGDHYQTQNSNQHTRYFKIQAHAVSGKKYTVAESLPGRAAAQEVLESIAALSGYPSQ